MKGSPHGIPAHSDWRARAACVGEDPELFFPLSDSVAFAGEASVAQALCRRCPVLIACRTWAIEHGEDHGIWGATTAAQRRAIRRAVAGPGRAAVPGSAPGGRYGGQETVGCDAAGDG